MKAYGLFTGRHRPKVVEISMRPDDLWWCAWTMSGHHPDTAPIKIGPQQQRELRQAGYDVKPIMFQRMVEGGAA